MFLESLCLANGVRTTIVPLADFLHLRSAAQPLSEEMMLATSFCGDYGNVFTSLLANTDYETMLEAFQMGVSLLVGYLLALWDVVRGPKGEKRLASFARGAVALTQYVQKSKSLVEAFCSLHQ